MCRLLQPDERIDEAEISGVVEKDVVALSADIGDGEKVVAEEVAVFGMESEDGKMRASITLRIESRGPLSGAPPD